MFHEDRLSVDIDDLVAVFLSKPSRRSLKLPGMALPNIGAALLRIGLEPTAA